MDDALTETQERWTPSFTDDAMLRGRAPGSLFIYGIYGRRGALATAFCPKPADLARQARQLKSGTWLEWELR